MELHTTKCKTANGTVYDLGLLKYPPSHDHGQKMSCPSCRIVDAWTEARNEP